jgi:uncharacterized membrane protein YphA (DoxX/SURF4 family)
MKIDTNTGELIFLYLGSFFAIVLAGPGRFSLDSLAQSQWMTGRRTVE